MTMQTQQQEGGAGAPPGQGAGGQAPPAAPPPTGGYGTATRAPLGSPSGTDTAPPAGATEAAAPPPPAKRPTDRDVPPVALSERLKRAGRVAGDAEKRRWAEALGADDPAKVKERLERLAELERQAEEQKRAQMGELERAKADLDATQLHVKELEAELERMREEQLYSKQDALITNIANLFIDPDAIDLARAHFAKHVRELPPEQQEKMTERDVKKFFEKWVQARPKFARTAETPVGASPAPKPATKASPTRPTPPAGAARKPITNGTPPARGAGAPPLRSDTDPSMLNGKTAKPGQKNSMTRAELKEFAAKNGVNYPG